jgi:hypothetical protein
MLVVVEVVVEQALRHLALVDLVVEVLHYQILEEVTLTLEEVPLLELQIQEAVVEEWVQEDLDLGLLVGLEL